MGITPYNFAANSPILLTDPDGRDIKFSWQKDEDGKITGINITVTGKVIDNTSKGISDRKLNKYRDRIIKGLTSKIKSSDKNFSVNVTANIGIAKKETDFTKTDHAFRIVDDIYKVAGITPIKGGSALGYAPIGDNVVYLDKRFTKRTAPHEIGHSASLQHIKNEEKNGQYGKPLSQTILNQGRPDQFTMYNRYSISNGDLRGNLMHQAIDRDKNGRALAGDELELWQFNQMMHMYKNGKLNSGKQK